MSKQLADQAVKVNLVGVYLMPQGDWVVEDNSKAGANKYLCPTKETVLAKIGELLDQMAPPKA
jgi:hypothetical protein